MNLLLICILALLSSKSGHCHAEDITTIGIRTENHSEISSTTARVVLILWFDFTIYQCVVYPTSKDTQYSCDTSEITVLGSHCQSPDTKLLIDNSEKADAVVIANVFIKTANGVLYGIEDICINDDATIGNWYRNIKVNDGNEDASDDSNENVADKPDTNICPSSSSQYSAICVDNESVGSWSCGPGKQLVYFDRNKPNTYINDALWLDGTDVSIDTATCAPTADPTESPTISPSRLPTVRPTPAPTCVECTCDCDVATVSLCMKDQTSNAIDQAFVTNNDKVDGNADGNDDEINTGTLRVAHECPEEQDVSVLYVIIAALIAIIIMLIGAFAIYTKRSNKLISYIRVNNQKTLETESKPILNATSNGNDV